ncbi:MAG: acyltransferase family protein [Legionella sp.]|jgi:peptidoglycan/LPS O-acetylase OafA/YrhL
MNKEIASSYRPEIDGLRAIAVLSVLFYHLGISGFSGGFLGVDVFFVISGYLITRLLALEFKTRSHINFRQFYLRRCRRLLPALIFTLIITTLVALALFTPQRLELFGGSLLHSIISTSNIYFFLQSGYFDIESSLKPLMHTWSLGVEEQFYLIWPIILLCILPRKYSPVLIFFLISLLSFSITYYVAHSHSTAAFFLMPFRIFEFSIGAILVFVAEFRVPKVAANVLFLLGLGFIIFSVCFYNGENQFIHMSTLFACSGAALCIQASRNASFAAILKTRLLVGIGLISYSLYLIHWPIIVFTKYQLHVEKFSINESILLLLLSFVIAILMYYFVEKPFRTPKIENRKFLVTTASFFISTACLGALIWMMDGWDWRPWMSNKLTLEAINNGKNLRFLPRQNQCIQKGWDKCDELQPDRVNGLIIGDSLAVDALNAFTAIAPQHNYALSTFTGCPPYNHIEKIVNPGHPRDLIVKCKVLNKKRYDVSYLKQFDYIVINALFSWYSSEHLREYLRFLKKNDIHKVIVFGNYFSVNEELPELINKFGFIRDDLDKFITDTNEDDKVKKYSEELGYLFISKKKVFYNNGAYELFDKNKIPFTYDRFHLSYEFAVRLAVQDKDKIFGFLALQSPINTVRQKHERS